MEKWIVDARHPKTAESMICSLAGMCNHASSMDGTGFSKMDAEFGHSLAQHAASGRPWTAKQAESALKLIQKYRRQLGGKEFVDSWMENPIFRQEPSKHSDNPVPARRLSSQDSNAVFSFQYDPQVVQDIKCNLRGEHRGKKYYPIWNPTSKTWTVPVNETSISAIMDIAARFGFEIEQRFVEYVNRLEEKTRESRVMLTINDGRHVVIAGDSIVISVADASILKEFEEEFQGTT